MPLTSVQESADRDFAVAVRRLRDETFALIDACDGSMRDELVELQDVAYRLGRVEALLERRHTPRMLHAI